MLDVVVAVHVAVVVVKVVVSVFVVVVAVEEVTVVTVDVELVLVELVWVSVELVVVAVNVVGQPVWWYRQHHAFQSGSQVCCQLSGPSQSKSCKPVCAFDGVTCESTRAETRADKPLGAIAASRRDHEGWN